MQQNQALANAALAVARTEIGQKEATGDNDGPFVLMLQRWLANGAKWMDRQPWCATFATWCVYKGADKLGIKPILKKNGSSTSLYDFARANGWLCKPTEGCIGLMKGTGGTAGKNHHHTFLVESVDFQTGLVHGIDGNWSNAVIRTAHRIVDCDFMVIA